MLSGHLPLLCGYVCVWQCELMSFRYVGVQCAGVGVQVWVWVCSVQVWVCGVGVQAGILPVFAPSTSTPDPLQMVLKRRATEDDAKPNGGKGAGGLLHSTTAAAGCVDLVMFACSVQSCREKRVQWTGCQQSGWNRRPV